MIQSPEAPWAVELARFSKAYRPTWSARPVVAVHDLSLRVPAGEICGLLGPNGSGKSTTLKALAGLVAPSAGEGRIHGYPAGSLAARRLCGFLPESPRFAPYQTGREFLQYCAGLAGVDVRAVDEVLAWSGLGEAANRRLGNYSKGMMQRLGLAQAMLGRPSVLLLDEPDSGLAPEGRPWLLGMIRAFKARGSTVIFTSHLFTQVVAVCDRVVILGSGRVLASGALTEVLGERGQTNPAARLEDVYLERLGHA